MNRSRSAFLMLTAAVVLVGIAGCTSHYQKFGTWPSGNVKFEHAKPAEGGYYSNYDPNAVTLEVEPVTDVNPVRTQHIFIATVKDKDGKPLDSRRVEWIIAEGSIGDIVEVDESGLRDERGYKVDNKYAVSHTNRFEHVLTRGNDDPSDDIKIGKGQTWCVITSPVEGTTNMIVYAPGIFNWEKHKVFVTKHWYDVKWTFPPAATNPVGTDHVLMTKVMKYSDNSPLKDYEVTYKITGGPDAVLVPGDGQTATVKTDAAGEAKVTLRQVKPAEGTNTLDIVIVRPKGECCGDKAAKMADGKTTKTWIGPRIAITKTAPARAKVGDQFNYSIVVTNPSKVNATNVVVTDTLPDGIKYASSSPAATAAGQDLTWNLGTLAGGASRTISVTVSGSREGTFRNCASVKADYGLAGQSCAETVIAMPKLSITKTAPADVLVCDMIPYTIVVKNEGSAAATNVMVRDDLPDGLMAIVDGKETSAIKSSVGTLPPGESRTIKFSAKAAKPGNYTNTANVTADDDLKASDTAKTAVHQPVLTVTKTGPQMRYIGAQGTYEITVANKGDAPAASTVLTDVVPAGTRFVSADNNGAFAGGKVTWDLGTIAAGQSKKVSVVLAMTQIGEITNTATATAVCASAEGSVKTVVQGRAAILLEMVDERDPIEVGANETYTITVTNQGSAADKNVVITATIPAEEEFVSASGPVAFKANGKVITFEPLADLGAGKVATYKVVVKGLKQADARFKVILKSDMIQSPVEETESTHIYE